MSRILGNVHHLGYVYPDFDEAVERFAAGGIGPFFAMHETEALSIYRGELLPLSMSIAFTYSGDTCIEIITPTADQQASYNDFLSHCPHGGLHHIAYLSEDFDATRAKMAQAGKPLDVVQEFVTTPDGEPFEVYTEPAGIENPTIVQLLKPGLFDAWFAMIRDAAATWDGNEPIREAGQLLADALADGGA
jgi:catechol 2,3-dioxygenase-like lactoylglutathione lyase family enzyme